MVVVKVGKLVDAMVASMVVRWVVLKVGKLVDAMVVGKVD